MRQIRLLRSLAVSVGALCLVAACGGGGGGSTQNLAANQTLTFALQNDLTYLDPAQLDSAVDITFSNEVFTGLYKFDNSLNIVPSGATALPTISSDGKTWTFKLRHDMVFSNGDKITAKDWIYSWTRTLKINGAYASNLEAIQGGFDVENGAATLSGLSAPDDYTLVAQLHDPAGYWLTQLAMPVASEVVDQKVLAQTGGASDPWDVNGHWTENASTYIGSGPFKMTARTPKQSMDFVAVPNWWGGSTGHLTKVHVDIGIDPASIVQKFESGGYDLVGMANQAPGPDDVLRYKNDPTKSKLLTIFPGARSTAVGFDFVDGPFAPKTGVTPGQPTNGNGVSDPGLPGRQAFAMAIDRAQLADIACAHAITCAPASGGPIPKGFKGYLGDNADPNSKFDAAKAKQLLDQWDPNKTKRNNLEYRYNSSPGNDKIAQNLQAQWMANLGVNVKLAPSDFPTLEKDRKAKRVIMGRESWSIDYDHPQDWFDNLYVCDQAKIGKGNDQAYCNPDMDKLVADADAKPIATALPEYVQAEKILVNDVVWATMIYGTQPYIIASYVKGAGYNALYDYNWEGISILQH
jgi:ABC-type oligopeptide transport system substrate-binding subunit